MLYQKIKSENSFSVIERKTGKPSNDINKKVTQFSEDESKSKQNLFIIHEYHTNPSPSLTNIKMQYLSDQIKYYMNNRHISIAKFQGFSMTDSKLQFIPTVLTKRPVKGPLSSLFEKESVNAEQKFCMICGILSAIQFINKGKLIHSNLNPSTIYIDAKFRVKVCDYIFIPSFGIYGSKTSAFSNDVKYMFLSPKKMDPAEFYKNGNLLFKWREKFISR